MRLSLLPKIRSIFPKDLFARRLFISKTPAAYEAGGAYLCALDLAAHRLKPNSRSGVAACGSPHPPIRGLSWEGALFPNFVRGSTPISLQGNADGRRSRRGFRTASSRLRHRRAARGNRVPQTPIRRLRARN